MIFVTVIFTQISVKKETFYAVFWTENGNIYLEKYICENCFESSYSDKKAIPFKRANKTLQEALYRDFQRDWHGIVVSCSSVEEFKEIIENPLLLEVIGEKF